MRAGRSIILLLAATALLSACGKKGAPVPPPGEIVTYPHAYPTAPKDEAPLPETPDNDVTKG